MKTRLVRIGNSRGIRLPKPLIDQCRLGEDVNLEVKDYGIVISPIREAREGWDEAFKLMHSKGDDQLLDSDTESKWDDEQWEWK